MNNNTVSFSKNGAEIKDTYLNIINNATEGLKWLVITNDASNELYVEETGESLKDFVDFLKEDATKVKYGICKTIPPGSDVEKLLFIGFCSDYLSIKPKMSFMKNLQIVRDDLFNNYHVMMEIRDESDLSYEAISKRLGDAAGARYSIQTGNSKGSLLHGGSPVSLPQRTIPKPTSSSSSTSSASSIKKPSPIKSPSPVEKKITPVFEKKSTPTTPVVEKATPIIEKATPVVEKAAPTPAAAPKIAPKKEQVVDDDEDDWSEPPLEEKEIGHKGSYTTSNWTPIGKVDLKKLIAEEKAKVDPRLVKESYKPAFVAKKKIEVPVEKEEEEEAEEEAEEEEEKEEEEVEKEEELVKEEVEATVEKEEEKEEKPAAPKSEAGRQADIEAYLAKMSKKSGPSNFDLKKAEKIEPISATEEKPPTLPSKTSTKTVSSFTPEIIKPRPTPAKKEIETEEEEVKVSKQNYKKFGIPLPGLHVEEPEPKVAEQPAAKESDDGWSDDEDDEEEKKPVPAARSIPSLPPRNSASNTPAPVEHVEEENEEDE